LLAQEVTNIALAVFILHNHFVAAFSAIDNTMKRGTSYNPPVKRKFINFGNR
jgi:hypothetical protein